MFLIKMLGLNEPGGKQHAAWVPVMPRADPQYQVFSGPNYLIYVKKERIHCIWATKNPGKFPYRGCLNDKMCCAYSALDASSII